MRKTLILLLVLVCSAAAFGQTTEGSLYAVDKTGTELGACPLKTTAVRADISGFISRVRVRQEFENTFTEPIEAIYVFPLSQNGAVDGMTMTVGTRVIRGKIMRREEARQTYETAKSEGKTASLLDQERPNIFTQSVANIMPGERVIVEIAYVETLKYEDGAYEFVFPMVVAPRYIPGSVTDAAKISPPIAATRAGHDISIEVNLNAGVPVEEIRSSSHAIDQVNFSPNTSKVTLRGEKTIPNKDFILRYDVTGKRIEDAVLVHRDPRRGFFTLILQPPDKIATEDRTPKEIVFVLDTSGSMGGFPIEKAKEAMKLSLDGLYPNDTFNLITFAGDTDILFNKPVPATRANLERAQAFLDGREGSGGTEMMKAIKAALAPSGAQDHLRIVCFMTDGHVGNDNEIIAEVQKHPNARVFSFGIGSSVNRHLLDKIALEGKGEAEYVGLNDDGSKAAKKFYERVRTPLLTDLSIDWNGMPVADVYPNRLTDLFSAKPVILHGRYNKAVNGTIKLKGKVAGQPYERSIAVNFPETENANDALSTLWARTRIDELSSARLKTQDAKAGSEMDALITSLGLDFGLLTNFTSFVAVEDRVVNQNGNPVTVEVPVEFPEGMDRKTTLGDDDTLFRRMEIQAALQSPPAGGGGGGGANVTPTVASYGLRNAKSKKTGKASGSGTGQGSGTGSGAGGGLGSGSGSVTTSGNDGSPPPPSAPSGSQATVNVTATDANAVDTTSTTVESSITAQTVEVLPKGLNFSTILNTSPGTNAELRGSGFQVDGESGADVSFIVDGQEVKNVVFTGHRDLPSSSSMTISGGVLNGRSSGLQKPDYPAAALAVKADGSVNVEITIDETGNVTTAKAVSGHPLLLASAEKAALASKFAPTFVGKKAVKVNGVIVYNFRNANTVKIAVDKMKVAPQSPEDKKRLQLTEKLHSWLYALVDRLNKGDTKPSTNEAMFVRDGKAEIEVELSTRSPEVIEKLKAAGLEVVAEIGKTAVTGRIALERLAALAEIDEVKLVLPKI